MQDTAIQVSHLTKQYKLYNHNRDRVADALGFGKRAHYTEHLALNDVSMTIRKGETVGIIGTNGSGKSTILKIITGVLTPTSGEVAVNGRISALLELGAGFNMEYNGKISNESPVGLAIMGQPVGSVVDVVVGENVIQYQIMEIKN